MEDRIPYKTASFDQGPEYYDYENFEPQWQSEKGIELIKKLGRGKYSDVYEGINSRTDEKVVIKILKPVRNSKVLREIKILESVQGGPNIIKLYKKCYNEKYNTTCLIFEYVYEENFREVSQHLNDLEIRYYLFQILKALDFCHSKGIIHRDVKPRNIIVDPKRKIMKLIDWGLSEYYLPDKPYNVRVASRAYKGPELLVNFKKYDYSLDLWSTGCVFGSMLFRVYHIFLGRDNADQLVKISEVLGTDDLHDYLHKYKIKLNKKEHSKLKARTGTGWSKYINSENQHLCHEEALDLLGKLLTYDHALRPTAKEAMSHSYFDPVRNLDWSTN